MVGVQTNPHLVLRICRDHCLLIMELFPRKALSSTGLLSSQHLFCCKGLGQLDFPRVFGKAHTACWASQPPSDAWDAFLTLQMRKFPRSPFSPPKACPQMVLHAWHWEEKPSLSALLCSSQHSVWVTLLSDTPRGCPKSPLASISEQHFWRVVPCILLQTWWPQVKCTSKIVCLPKDLKKPKNPTEKPEQQRIKRTII